MVKTSYGVRNYTTSEKTKRSQKIKVDESLSPEEKEKQIQEIIQKQTQEINKRNDVQKRLYITLENIDEMFSENDKYPISYSFLFNLIQGKVTKFYKTTYYERKKELSYAAIAKLYSVLKRKLLNLNDKRGLLNPKPVLFFYLSQFFRYIDLVVYSTVAFGTIDLKFELQELEDLPLIEELIMGDNSDVDAIIEKKNKKEQIQQCIDKNPNLTPKEKSLIYKIYKTASIGGGKLSNRDLEDLKLLQEKLQLQPGLLQDLEDICND